MKRLIISLAVVAALTCGSEVAQAKGRHGHAHGRAGHGHAHGRAGHHHVHGRFGHFHAGRHFHVYHGKHNRFWARSRVDARYGGVVYLSPTGDVWYYYAPYDDRYYPTVFWPKGVNAPSN